MVGSSHSQLDERPNPLVTVTVLVFVGIRPLNVNANQQRPGV
jgi:hypothetical protein